MTGLLLKDLMNLRQQWKIYLLIIGVWAFVCVQQQSVSFFGSMMTLLAVMTLINAIAYDERAHWDRYALTLPFTRRNLVTAKYLLLALVLLLGLVLFLALGLITSASLTQLLSEIPPFLSIGLLLSAITLPLLLKFGTEKGRMVLVVVAMLVAFLPPLLNSQADIRNTLPLLTQPWLLPAAAIAAIAVSYAVSVGIYKKKEF